MTDATTPASPAPLAQLRTLAGALMAGLVMLGVVAFVVLGGQGYPPSWVAWGLGAAALAAHLATEAVGYRVPAVPPGSAPEEAAAAGLAAYRASMMLRFALCEAVAIVALAAAFVIEPRTAQTYLVGGTLALLLLWWHTWPSERVVRRVQSGLDRAGGRSHLADALHGRALGSTGPHPH